ncbi:site-specific integrase [Alicyclobacillus fastidiosus]|uniref:Site-specific integrase n=1 Tax=Alicyclobacillus fastidiosus TaxID=392011 RepID=A0ABV5AHG6_9BACL|nr:site-specific integrase [Alicyclobacillus fastidiosus]WEH09184.1 site-specific integrase [Alicyclobacillus fastidiosus]
MEFVEPIKDRNKVEAMKKLLRGSSLRNYALFSLGCNAGLRVSDLLRLTVSNVRDERGRIKDRVQVREAKTGKLKDFPISDSASKALGEYLATRRAAHDDEPLFLSRKGGHLTRQQARRIVAEAAQAVGVRERVGTHSMRKTLAYHVYREGKDIALVQSLLNHSNPAVTLRYIGVTKEDVDTAVLRINL